MSDTPEPPIRASDRPIQAIHCYSVNVRQGLFHLSCR